jgi:hypothetical protein
MSLGPKAGGLNIKAPDFMLEELMRETAENAKKMDANLTRRVERKADSGGLSTYQHGRTGRSQRRGSTSKKRGRWKERCDSPLHQCKDSQPMTANNQANVVESYSLMETAACPASAGQREMETTV